MNNDVNSLTAMKKEIAYFMRLLYKRGLTTTSGGNISAMLDGFLLITPSQTDKGRMKASDIIVFDAKGRNISKALRPSMETGMHMAIYAARPDVKAIVHAHPVAATGFAASHRLIDCNLIGESRALIGEPVIAPYRLMGTDDLAAVVAEACVASNAVLLANHGVLTVGNSLLEAFDRMEVLEACARINLIAKMLGGGKPLSNENLIAIDKLMNP